MPGGTGSRLFGATASVYFLSLRELQHGGSTRPETDQDLDEYCLDGDRIKFTAAVFGAAKHIQNNLNRAKSNRPWSHINEVGPALYEGGTRNIADFFVFHTRGADRRLLQMKVEEYACTLLVSHWDELWSGRLVVAPPLIAKIGAECLSPKLRRALTEEGFPTTDQYDGLVHFMFQTTSDLARKIMREACGPSGERLSKAEGYAILPLAGGDYGRIVITAARSSEIDSSEK